MRTVVSKLRSIAILFDIQDGALDYTIPITMSAYVGIQRLPSTCSSKQYSNIAPTCPISGEKPPPPPRPEKPFRPPRPTPTPVVEPRVKHGPEDFPRKLSLDLQPHEREGDLSKFLFEMKLPQLIRISESFEVPGSNTTLNKDDVLLLHFIYDNPIVHATTLNGTKLRLPIQAEQKYEILPLDPRLDDVEYEGTIELMNANPLPTKVRVLEAHCSTCQDEIQDVDDIIEIEGFEHDNERGKLLVGKCGTLPIKYSADLDSCIYTTMISSNFHRLTELKDHKFPQRVRIPDEGKAFSERNFKEEQVLHLNSYSTNECVVATRVDDPHIYSIPVATPIKFTNDPITKAEKHILDMCPALYPLVNTSWGMVDPTQQVLKPSMETIPHPIQRVLEAWIGSEEGKAYACDMAEQREEDIKEEVTVAHKEMRRMKAELETFRNRKSTQQTPSDASAPSRPPRPKPDNKPPDIPKRPVSSSGGPPRLPPRPADSKTTSTTTDSASDSDEYEEVDVTKDPKPKGASPDILRTMKDILSKKEKELQEERQRVAFWKTKCEVLEMAVPFIPDYEELPELPSPPANNEDLLDEDNYLAPIPLVPPSHRQAPLKDRPPTVGPRHKSGPRSIRSWTVADVGKFLLENGMGQYVDVFRKNDVNGSLLADLQECHLHDLTMTPHHASKLRDKINKFGKRSFTLNR